MTEKQKDQIGAWLLASIWTATLVWTGGLLALILMTGDVCDQYCIR